MKKTILRIFGISGVVYKGFNTETGKNVVKYGFI